MISGKYSKAFFEAALEENQLDLAVSEFDRFMTLFTEAERVLLSPTVSAKEKNAVVETMQLEGLIRSFVLLLIEKDRLSFVREIRARFDEMVEEYHKTATAYVTTAVAMDDAQIADLKARLEASAGLKIKLVCEIDADLIGGMVIRIGDKVLDGSVRNKLQNMLESIREIK